MKAAVCVNSEFEVVELPSPRPGPGQVVLDVVACGICGSDLHARHHGDAQADVLAEIGYDGFARTYQRVVFGHEFCGTVADYGPDTAAKVKPGTPVVALPLIRQASGMHPIGLSAEAPGAYAEQVVVEEAFMFPIPNGLPTDVAVLTEPLAVAQHAVARSGITKKDAAVVVGCGPVGLAVICVLKARGVGAIVASDLSEGRRRLAVACGATAVVDPRVDSPYSALGERGYATSMTAAAGAGLKAMKQLQKLPVPWPLVLRTLDKVGATKPKRPLIFECVGVPGIIEGIITAAPLGVRVVVAGVCMQPDTFRPAMAINKEIDLRFVVGYGPLEFRDTLHMLAEGKIDARPLLTGTVGLDGVSAAFEALADPEAHAKIAIDPASAAKAPVPIS
jgi:threonine dehydrogenase-like Zn-dependent dehydrogenase